MNVILPIFQFLKSKQDAGLQAVLVTLVAVTGASTRNPGAHMAVAEDGSFAGSFSGGCVETAVVAEAIEVMKLGRPREVRFGAGSEYLDIRLPCGGGIDLLFNPLLDASFAENVLKLALNRRPLSLALDSAHAGVSCIPADGEGALSKEGSVVHVTHAPEPKLKILGHGASVLSLAKLTKAYGLRYEVFSPDKDIVEQIHGNGGAATLLKTPAAMDQFEADRWTACIFYFHDHDWEAALMKQALQSDAYYIGAMGSMKTHQNRLKFLSEIGTDPNDVNKMVAPIGLIPSSRDPETLALSTLAQVVDGYHKLYGV